MNPDLEPFLQSAFAQIERGSSTIGRVAVEPDYESGSIDGDPQELRKELTQLLDEQKNADPGGLVSHEGIEISVPQSYPELAKCLRRIVLHGDRAEGPWIEVIPPGNWI